MDSPHGVPILLSGGALPRLELAQRLSTLDMQCGQFDAALLDIGTNRYHGGGDVLRRLGAGRQE